MALSEHEQRILDQIEQSLYAEDPKFKAAVKKSSRRGASSRHLQGAIALVIVGLAVLVGGVWLQNVFVGVFGFLVMFAGGALGVRAVQSGAKLRGGNAPAVDKNAAPEKSTMKDRIEDRMRRRFEE